MKFYNIADEYINFLRTFDSKVSENKQESRPYIGVVIEIEKMKYYAPFTSPKAKHRKMKNGKDFRKIQGGEYGAINFNNMIPVPDCALKMIDIDNESDQKYRRLLQNQYRAIRADSEEIIKTAARLRKLVMTGDENLTTFDKRIKERCCNLKIIEQVYTQFNMKQTNR